MAAPAAVSNVRGVGLHCGADDHPLRKILSLLTL